jgi:hypothetical protein
MPNPQTQSAISHRYRDAYAVSSTIVGFGDLIKVLGCLFGGLIALGGLLMMTQGGLGFATEVGAVVWGGVTATLIYLFGIVVAAQGQILRATLDTAVNTSPFLDNPSRAEIMTVPLGNAASAPTETAYQGGM